MRRLRRALSSESGQVLALVIVILLVASTLVPLMVLYSQRESIWTAKQAATTTAFHLAEAGTEKAYLFLSQSTQTWIDIQAGTLPNDYKFDKKYEDLSGGYYTISITSGPEAQQATVISIGKDSLGREVRAIKAVYANSPLGGVAIFAGGGIGISNKVQVEWGAAISPQNVILTGANTTSHPQFWSAGSIDVFDSNPSPPNCDSPNCCQWHTYATNIPAQPVLDLNFYKSSATLSDCGGDGTGAQPLNSCYFPSSQSNWNYTLSGKTVYIDGDLGIKSGGVDIVGNTLVMGNLNLPNGVWGKGTHTMHMPKDAWKQYCNDWSYYISHFDATGPAAFPGLNADYQSPSACNPSSNCVSSKLAFDGLLYVGGNFNQGGGGGGGTDVFGLLYSLGTSTETANSQSMTFYYDGDQSQNLQTTQIILSRLSWQDMVLDWPSGL